MKLLIIVLTVVIQNALQTSITECHPDRKRGVICLRKENIGTSKSGEQAQSIVNTEADRRYQEKSHGILSTEDISVSYEGLRNIAEDVDSSKSIHKVKIEHLRNFQDQDDTSYNDENLRFDSYENRRDIPVAMDKSETEEEVSYKSHEKLHKFSGLKYISESEEKVESEPLKYIRKSPKNRVETVKYENFEKFRSQMGDQHWKFGPNQLENNKKFQSRFFPWIIGFVFQTVVSVGVSAITAAGQTVEKAVKHIVGK